MGVAKVDRKPIVLKRQELSISIHVNITQHSQPKEMGIDTIIQPNQQTMPTSKTTMGTAHQIRTQGLNIIQKLNS